MTCKVCGRTGERGDKRRFFVSYLNVLEPLCWVCVHWVKTGSVMPERRS